MSIVEKALAKAQQASHSAQASLPPVPVGVPGPAVAVVEAVPSGEPAREPIARALPAPPARKLHIDVAALRAAGVLPPQPEERNFSAQFRTIKRPLLRYLVQAQAEAPNTGGRERSILVGSALPGDGKTFTAINLALSLARERDHSVVFVDGDVAKRHATEVFGLGGARGLVDVLADPAADVASVLVATDVAGLTLVPAGTTTESSTELLASARMRALLADLLLQDPRRIIVFDSPPLLITSEAPVLSALFGQVLLVVRADGTPRPAVLDALHIIGPEPHTQLVLNQVDGGPLEDYYYGYGYGYGYGNDAQGSGARSDADG